MPSIQDMGQDCLGTRQKPHAHNQKCKKFVKQLAQLVPVAKRSTFYQLLDTSHIFSFEYEIQRTLKAYSEDTHGTYSKDHLKRLYLALPLLKALNNRGKYRRLQLLNSESSVLIKKASPEMPALKLASISINLRQTKPKFPTWNPLFTHSKKELFM